MINKAFKGEESLLEAEEKPCLCGCLCVVGGQSEADDAKEDGEDEVKEQQDVAAVAK